MSKIFPAGCGWQVGYILSTPAFQGLPFYTCVGLGEGLAVFYGHVLYTHGKSLLTPENSNIDENALLRKEKLNGFHLGTAAMASGMSWQPLVDMCTGHDFITTGLTTGSGCGLAFFTTLGFVQTFTSGGSAPGCTTLKEIDVYQKKLNRRNLGLSLSIAGAAAMFVATDPLLPGNLFADYFGITENMSDFESVFRAGMSTATGFTMVQSVQNIFPNNWLDEDVD